MSDIVERLRDQGRDAFAKQYSLGMWKLCDEAASEIKRLRDALEHIAGFPDWPERADHEMTGMRITYGHLRALRRVLANSPADRTNVENTGSNQS